MIKIIELLNEHNIPFYTEGHKQCRPGWINIPCPFCGGSNPYLGINLTTGAVNCYRCETHGQTELIQALLSISWNQAEKIRKQYTIGGDYYLGRIKRNNKVKEEEKPELLLPHGSGKIGDKHKEYLIKRGFTDPNKLIKEWNLAGTNHLGEYRGRIVAPMYKDNELVSYQCRDITDKQTPKYKACPKEKEIIHHKNYLYGVWKTNKYSVVVVEGIVDVWKLGPGAVATFGIKWKKEQALILLPFQKISIMFDPEEQAQIQGEKLAALLKILGKKVTLLNYEKYDPGDMGEKEAHRILNKYLL